MDPFRKYGNRWSEAGDGELIIPIGYGAQSGNESVQKSMRIDGQRLVVVTRSRLLAVVNNTGCIIHIMDPFRKMWG